ncbi:MAG: PRC-barrel domain-containing protein [Bacillota bacterium]|nr:PRC-barrel domain-containing protein [Bacillota bacterium]
MKLRNIKNLPVLLEVSVETVGRVDKAVIGDNYCLLYIVVNLNEGKQVMIFRDDFYMTKEAVMIWEAESMKSYAHGEELTVYEKKLGDCVYSPEGRELGTVSDFILDTEEKSVQSIEVSSGAIRDWLDGRIAIPLEQIRWASDVNVMVNQEGSD